MADDDDGVEECEKLFSLGLYYATRHVVKIREGALCLEIPEHSGMT